MPPAAVRRQRNPPAAETGISRFSERKAHNRHAAYPDAETGGVWSFSSGPGVIDRVDDCLLGILPVAVHPHREAVTAFGIARKAYG